MEGSQPQSHPYLPVGDTGDGHCNPQCDPHAQAEALTVPRLGPCEYWEKPMDDLKHVAHGIAAGSEGQLQQLEVICM